MKKFFELLSQSMRVASKFSKEMMELENIIVKVRMINTEITMDDIQELLKFYDKKRAEVPFKCPENYEIIDNLYMQLSRGLNPEDAIIMTKSAVIDGIQSALELYTFNKLKELIL